MTAPQSQQTRELSEEEKAFHGAWVKTEYISRIFDVLTKYNGEYLSSKKTVALGKELSAVMKAELATARQQWVEEVVSAAGLAFGKDHRNFKEFEKAIGLTEPKGDA